MKRTLIALLLLFSKAYSQELINSYLAKQFLINQSLKLSPQEIISKCKQIQRNWIRYSEDDEQSAPFESAFNLNVFDYF